MDNRWRWIAFVTLAMVLSSCAAKGRPGSGGEGTISVRGIVYETVLGTCSSEASGQAPSHLYFLDGATRPIGGGPIDPSVAIATATLGTLSTKALPPAGGACWMKAPYSAVLPVKTAYYLGAEHTIEYGPVPFDRLKSAGFELNLGLETGISFGRLATPPDRPQPTPSVQSDAEGQDGTAQATLREAIAAAKTYFVRGDTYAAFSAARGASIDRSLHWVDGGRADLNRVHVKFVSARKVVLSTRSATGTPFCVADDADVGSSFGRVDADTVAACTGGW